VPTDIGDFAAMSRGASALESAGILHAHQL